MKNKISDINNTLDYLNKNYPNATLCITLGEGFNIDKNSVEGYGEQLKHLQKIKVEDSRVLYYTDDKHYHTDFIAGPIIKVINLIIYKRKEDDLNLKVFTEYLNRKLN